MWASGSRWVEALYNNPLQPTHAGAMMGRRGGRSSGERTIECLTDRSPRGDQTDRKHHPRVAGDESHSGEGVSFPSAERMTKYQRLPSGLPPIVGIAAGVVLATFEIVKPLRDRQVMWVMLLLAVLLVTVGVVRLRASRR